MGAVHVWWFAVICFIKESSLQHSSFEDASPSCDDSRGIVPKEGNIGESKHFPWLGVLRVHMHERTVAATKIALTGIVLVKTGYAIGNADDISRIPKRILQYDSRAMFIPKDEEPWYCAVKDYMTHPEFEYETMNTIALLELTNEDDNIFYPMKPVCWSSYSYSASNDLYAVGLTDENQLLEKSIYKLVYVEKSTCKEFYSRAGLSEGKMTPAHYQCGFAENNTRDCVWDNGMALVSNASQQWTLIGLSIHGPGCAAPARFIDLLHYYPWIESASNLQEIYDYDARKSGFNRGSKRTRSEGLDIPIHKLLRNNDSSEKEKNEKKSSEFSSPESDEIIPGKMEFANHYPSNMLPADLSFSIQRVSPTVIHIHSNERSKIGDCTGRSGNKRIYQDHIKILAPRGMMETNSATYKISMFDLYYLNYTCVRIEVNATKPGTAFLYYATKPITSSDRISDKTPQQFFKNYLNPYRHESNRNNTVDRHYKNIDKQHSINIELKVIFQDEGELGIAVYGPPKPPSPPLG